MGLPKSFQVKSVRFLLHYNNAHYILKVVLAKVNVLFCLAVLVRDCRKAPMAEKHFSVTLIPTFTLDNGSPQTITLNSEQDVSVVLGRSDITGIKDKRCSREHVRLRADSNSLEIVFSQQGSNASSVLYNGETFVLSKHDIKRIPLGKSALDSCVCSIYIIHKDQLYGYDIILKSKTAPTVETETRSIPLKSNGDVTKKRSSSTLDSFVTKKPKKEDNQNTDKSVVKGTVVYTYNVTYILHLKL